MGINFNSLCRLCMVQDDALLSLFNDDHALLVKIMLLAPVLKVRLNMRVLQSGKSKDYCSGPSSHPLPLERNAEELLTYET